MIHQSGIGWHETTRSQTKRPKRRTSLGSLVSFILLMLGFFFSTQDGHRVTTTTPSCSPARGGGSYLKFPLGTATTLRGSRSQTRCGRWLIIFFFTRGSRRIITTLTRSKIQDEGDSCFVFVFCFVLFFSLRITAVSPPPSPLAHQRKEGVVLSFFSALDSRPHHKHPVSLANARWVHVFSTPLPPNLYKGAFRGPLASRTSLHYENVRLRLLLSIIS